ncbi:hypothetical protein CKO28_01530 [Rhodovibrio sodomensis]|uniref:Secreted protein n=1 Tax=Rhodovibrio sodomensis TaxID=1088 RepID=A0ABS1DA06_9PROT|nr:hypothetical protein [Rhodovibrio sodomensis]MBK1666726.1 hypothetical protein [Rhodovibrio sodomensis]
MLRHLIALAACALLTQGCASPARDTAETTSRPEQNQQAAPDLPEYDPSQLDRIEIDEDANRAPEPKDSDQAAPSRPDSVKIDLTEQD